MAANLDFFQSETSSEKIGNNKPFFTTKGSNKQELLKWLTTEVENREAAHSEFFRDCFHNLSCYRGGYHKKAGRQSNSLEVSQMNRTSKYSVNHLYEMTENMISRITRVKPAVEVIPANDEFEDKSSAKAVSMLIKYLGYVNDLDLLIQKTHRHKYIFGNAYLMVDWNKDLGDLHPDYVKLRDMGKTNEYGDLKDKLRTPIKTGDVSYELKLPWEVLLEIKTDYTDVKTVIVKKLKHIEELKLEYPKMAAKLKTKKNERNFNLSSLRMEPCGDHVWVYTLYQVKDENFPEGRKVTFLHNEILNDEDLPYSHGSLPFVRLTDIDVPGKLHGMSRYQQVLILQNAHNNLSQSIMKNEFLMAAPKWVMPRGAAKIEQLGNGRTVIQYQGPVPPQLVQMNPTSPTTFAFRDQIEGDIGKLFGIHAVSRGEPPKGITAAVALQFLNEQESIRSVSDISKHNQFIVDISKHSISVAGDNYQVDDGRMLRILGKENKYMIKFFDASNLHKPYDVRIQNSTALPQSMAARMERILTTMQYAPTLFTPERWAELLEFGSVEKMHTLATEAITSAESENEDILEGVEVEEPKEYEDQLIHLRTHYKKMQARTFKEDVDPARREELIEHIKIHEMLAEEKAAKNPLFQAKLAQIEQYPMFWEPIAMPQSREQQEMTVQGQTNRGEEVTGAVPGTEPDEVPGEQTRRRE